MFTIVPRLRMRIREITAIVPNAAQGQYDGTISTFDANYNTVPTLAAVAGNYQGSAAVNGASGPTGLSIVDNAITVSGPGTCKANGMIEPHGTGNVYDIALTFTMAACSVAGKSMLGIAVPAPGNELVLATLDAGRVSGLLFSGSE